MHTDNRYFWFIALLLIVSIAGCTAPNLSGAKQPGGRPVQATQAPAGPAPSAGIAASPPAIGQAILPTTTAAPPPSNPPQTGQAVAPAPAAPVHSTPQAGQAATPVLVAPSSNTPAAGPTTAPVTAAQTTSGAVPFGQPVFPTPTGTGISAQGTPSPTSTLTTAVASQTGMSLADVPKPARDLRSLAMRLKPGVGNVPSVVSVTPRTYKVGDKTSFWIQNDDTQEHRQISATLEYVTPHVYMWVEDGVNLDQAALARSANLFENKSYPTDRQNFGSEWTPGVDGDPHLTVLHARGLGSSVAGYFSDADEYSHVVNPYSNEREMFYISADQGGAVPGTPYYDGVLAHEFQHMIHWAHHLNEDSWVNEGMSELAMHLNGFDTGGFDNLYGQHPGTQLDTWDDPAAPNSTDAEHYGASYLFMDYFLGRFGADLVRARVGDQFDSIAGFDDVLARAGRTERFDSIFADWLVANLVNEPQADSGRYGYKDITPPQPALAQTIQSYPAQGSGRVNQYGADYIALKPGPNMTIAFSGQPTVPVVNARPDGKYAWYSNRGDDDDTTLTRTVDLSKVPTATLTFSAWYNLEDGWDYTYVEASTDGGEHWQVLPGLHSRNTDKSGNAYGPGWTGISGGGNTPQWVQERVDLSPFAGKQIQLRFETVTDDAYNGPGFLLDDIAIPEIGFQDGGENGTNGWQAAGWVLTDNTLPEPWLVEVVAHGSDGLHVQQMQVGPDGRGQLTLPNAANYTDVTMIVSALAPVTTESGSYQYQISQATVTLARP